LKLNPSFLAIWRKFPVLQNKADLRAPEKLKCGRMAARLISCINSLPILAADRNSDQMEFSVGTTADAPRD
jgi:hypothetical protein